MSLDFNNIWVEKYRPKTLDDFVISEENKIVINSFTEKNEIPNLLFTGTPGIGKTSLAKIIVNDILKCQYLYINASDENGIDTIRTKVTNFAQTKSIDGKIKVIILDETDGLSLDGQRALRNTMEEHSKITRFILTANYKHRIIIALQSRCQSLDLVPPLTFVAKRCLYILKNENISISEQDKIKVAHIVKTFYPDLRKCINELHKASSSGKLSIVENKTNDVLKLILTNIQSKNILSLRKSLIENEQKFNSDYVNLLRGLFNFIDEKFYNETELNLELKKKYLLIIAEHLYRSAFVVDQEINCYSCFIQLSDIT
jgi:DNA polymerase III delta prime subunit